MAKFILSAFADEYSRNIDEQLAVLKRLGYTHIEPRFIGERNVADLSESDARDLKARLDREGISVYSVGSPIGKVSLYHEFTSYLSYAEDVFRNASILGARCVRVFSFYMPEGVTREEAFPLVVSKMWALCDLADKYGLTLCHENEAKIYGESPECCLALLEALGGRLRAVFDMGNFVLDGYNPVEAYTLLSDYIEYFHIKDALYERAIVPAGLGEAKIAEILTARRALGTDTVITLEPHLQTFDGLGSLTDSTYKNPYVFESQKAAFLAGADALKGVLEEIE